jgi:hypothetical protein
MTNKQSRTQHQQEMAGKPLKTPGGRKKLAAHLGVGLNRRLWFHTVAEQALIGV